MEGSVVTECYRAQIVQCGLANELELHTMTELNETDYNRT
jgi:hypothetical protein